MLIYNQKEERAKAQQKEREDKKMMKTMVKWGSKDEYGDAYEENACLVWFETPEEAESWKKEKRESLGGYFKHWETKQADYEKYLEMIELKKRIEELEKLF